MKLLPKKILLLPLLLVPVAFFITPIIDHSYKDDNISVTYQTKRGELFGDYVSYYSDGTTKSTGSFKWSLRDGEWTMYDKKGKVRAKVNYKMGVPDSVIFVSGKKDADKKDGVLITKRIWRLIPRDDRMSLFGDDTFYRTIENSFENGEITIYDDDQLQKQCAGKLPEYVMYDSLHHITGYRIKEDIVWYGGKIPHAETKIVSICPVMHLAAMNKDTDVCWINYSELEPVLKSKTFLFIQNGPTYIHNSADLLDYGHFASEIYKETNIYNRKISDYATGAKAELEAERIEISLIETENDMWTGESAK
ncbi:MAG: hypothetical protein HY064_04505 [Bacteroidetes bacterium]|nr:hypothetical protein [Bacteroidota bacterium]